MANARVVLAIHPPLPPGCFPTLWRNDERFVQTYFQERDADGNIVYKTFDWATIDDAGFVTITWTCRRHHQCRGSSPGTREIEEALSAHPAVAECAVVGVKDVGKGPGRFRMRGDQGRRATRRRQCQTRPGRRAQTRSRYAAWVHRAAEHDPLFSPRSRRPGRGKFFAAASAPLRKVAIPAISRLLRTPARWIRSVRPCKGGEEPRMNTNYQNWIRRSVYSHHSC